MSASSRLFNHTSQITRESLICKLKKERSELHEKLTQLEDEKRRICFEAEIKIDESEYDIEIKWCQRRLEAMEMAGYTYKTRKQEENRFMKKLEEVITKRNGARQLAIDNYFGKNYQKLDEEIQRCREEGRSISSRLSRLESQVNKNNRESGYGALEDGHAQNENAYDETIDPAQLVMEKASGHCCPTCAEHTKKNGQENKQESSASFSSWNWALAPSAIAQVIGFFTPEASSSSASSATNDMSVRLGSFY